VGSVRPHISIIIDHSYEQVLTCFSLYHVKVHAAQSVRYQNTHSRDPITLLSMDIMVETFLEIGVSDLLVSTRRLQDPLYMEV
jgi:hypothetical protein